MFGALGRPGQQFKTACKDMFAGMLINEHKHTYMCIYSYMHSYLYSYIYSYICSYMYSYIHVHMHILIHILIHIFIGAWGNISSAMKSLGQAMNFHVEEVGNLLKSNNLRSSLDKSFQNVNINVTKN